MPIFIRVALRIILGLQRQRVFSCWVCLELNLLRFVRFIIIRSFLNFRAGIKYFLVQRLGSGLLLISIFLRSREYAEIIKWIFLFSLSLKLAAAPFYSWLLSVALELDWLSFFLLRTIQKILPLFVLLQIEFWGLIRVSFLRASIASLSVVKEGRLKKIMVYSSVFSLAWFLGRFTLNLVFGYLLFYRARFWLRRKIWNIIRANEITHLQVTGLPLSVFLILRIRLLNFSGLPPFSIFYFKIRILVIVAKFVGRRIYVRILIISAIIFIFIYLRIGLRFLALVNGSPLKTENTIVLRRKGIVILMGSLVFFLLLYVYSKFWP